jgi:hypothetical protein
LPDVASGANKENVALFYAKFAGLLSGFEVSRSNRFSRFKSFTP